MNNPKSPPARSPIRLLDDDPIMSKVLEEVSHNEPLPPIIDIEHEKIEVESNFAELKNIFPEPALKRPKAPIPVSAQEVLTEKELKEIKDKNILLYADYNLVS